MVKNYKKFNSQHNMSSKEVLDGRLQWDLKKSILRGSNKARNFANKLKKLMKSGINPDNQSQFEALCKDLRLELTELRSHCEYNLVTQEMFNNLYQRVRRIVELSIDFFPGPQEAKQAEEEKEKKSMESSRLYSSLGFSWDDLRRLPEFFLDLLLQFLTSPCPNVDIHHQNSNCAHIASLFLSNKENFESLMKKEMKDKYVHSNAMHAKNCMGRGSDCATCLSYSLAHMIAHGLNRQEAQKHGYKPNLNLKNGLLWAAIKGGYGIQNTKFILVTFLKMCQSDSLQCSFHNWDALSCKRISTMTIPNMLDAISNPESESWQNLLGALTEYIDSSLKYKQRRKKFELRMLESDATHRGLFEGWRNWYSKKQSNSAFKPFPFLDRELLFEWNMR